MHPNRYGKVHACMDGLSCHEVELYEKYQTSSSRASVCMTRILAPKDSESYKKLGFLNARLLSCLMHPLSLSTFPITLAAHEGEVDGLMQSYLPSSCD